MELSQTVLALPGDHLADVSPELGEGDAANVLALWTALWHPALLARTRAIPTVRSVDTLVESPEDPRNLVIVPAIAEGNEVRQWQLGRPRAPRLCNIADRGSIIARLAELLEFDPAAAAPLDQEFYALGFAYFQVEMLTRSMHYSPLVSEESLSLAVAGAADGALAGDEATLDKHLADAYDLLMEARNHYYPIDFYLIDLSLIATTTSAASLSAACQAAHPGNFLATGELLDQLAQSQPAALDALRAAIGAGRASVCGGSQTSRPLASFGPESLLAELRQGLASFERHLNRRPAIFAHHAGPLAPLVPGILQKLGFLGTLTTNFSGQPLPRRTTARTSWIGLDNTQIEALNARPLDMGRASTFVGLSGAMSRAMDYDLAATLLLAGWPGHRSEFYRDLMRVTARSSVLGKPITLDDYFDVTSSVDHGGAISADDYPPPDCEACSEARQPSDRLQQLANFVGEEFVEPESSAAESLASLLGVDPRGEGGSHQDENGSLWFNGSSFERPAGVIRVPGFGWSWVPKVTVASGPPRAETSVLRNEHLEAWLDEQTGGISAVRLHDVRGNLLSQRLALTDRRASHDHTVFQLAIDAVEVVRSDAEAGGIDTRARVVNRHGDTMMEVTQTVTLNSGSRQVDVEFQVKPVDSRSADLALVSRLAYRDPTALVRRGLQGVTLPTSRRRIIARWIGLEGDPVPLAVICDEPRTHRRHGERMLDTVVCEEPSQPCRSRLSYQLDGRFPALTVAAEAEPESFASVAAGRPTQPSGWWLRLAAPNLHVTHLAVERHARGPQLRMRILETTGHEVRTKLSAWRPFTEAQLVDFQGAADQTLIVEDGAIRLHMAAYDWVELVATW